MQTSQIKEKLVQMLNVVNSIEKVEIELRAILGPINQYAVRPINQYVMKEPTAKAKPRQVELRETGHKTLHKNTRDSGIFHDNLLHTIKRVWYYTKENTKSFNPGEITRLLGITPKQTGYLWRRFSEKLGVVAIIERAPNREGKYHYKLTPETSKQIQELIA